MYATFCCIWFCVCVLSWVPLVLFANASLVFIYIVSAKFVCLPTRLNVQFRLLPPNEFISKPLCKVLFLFAIFLVLVFFCFFFLLLCYFRSFLCIFAYFQMRKNSMQSWQFLSYARLTISIQHPLRKSHQQAKWELGGGQDRVQEI